MIASFNGVKVFSATMFRDREVLGERVTEWLGANPDITITDKIVTQSSDTEFHCITITLFYRTKDCFTSKAEERQHIAQTKK